jgi:hypothetical protein
LQVVVKSDVQAGMTQYERGISKRLAFAFSERFGVSVAAFLEMK